MLHLPKTSCSPFLLLAAIGSRVGAQPRFAHPAWDALLKKHVSAKGAVDYRGFIWDSWC
jgi:hypothetical protein